MFDDVRSMFQKKDQNMESKRKVIVVVNQKGGCGKTTTCINLSAGLAKRGLKTLLIDLDPQAHSSLGLGIDIYNLPFSVYDVLVKNRELDQAILKTYQENLDIVPATSLLTGAQLEIADLLGRESLLRSNIARMFNTKIRDYDYVIMDCSPSLNLITINGLVAAQLVLIPIQAHYFSLEGMKELLSTIKTVKERINAELDVLGVLPTIFDSRTKMSREVLAQLRSYFAKKLLNSVIRMNITLAEASAQGKAIFDHDAACNGAKDYRALTEEIISLTRPELAATPPLAPTELELSHETSETEEGPRPR